MEEVRYSASIAAGPSNKDRMKELVEKQQNLRHVKEKSESAQELVQRIEGGLSHIGDLLGVEKREEDQTSSVGDLLRDIETALDTVLDEREKQLQQQGQQGSGNGGVSGINSPALLAIPGTESLRSPFSRVGTNSYEINRPHLELGYDVNKSFAKPRALRKRNKTGENMGGITQKGNKLTNISTPGDDSDDEDDEALDRNYLKSLAHKTIKESEKKAAKAAKSSAEALLNSLK